MASSDEESEKQRFLLLLLLRIWIYLGVCTCKNTNKVNDFVHVLASYGRNLETGSGQFFWPGLQQQDFAMSSDERNLEVKATLARKGLTHRNLAEAMRGRGHRFDSCDVARIIAGCWQPPDEIKTDIAALLGKPREVKILIRRESAVGQRISVGMAEPKRTAGRGVERPRPSKTTAE